MATVPAVRMEVDVVDDDDIRSEGATERKAQPTRISEMSEADAFRVLKGIAMSDMEAHAPWRRQATEDFGFEAGDQLSTEDKALLESQQRPIVTFNRTLTVLSAIAGMEINGRHEIEFSPRGNEDSGVAEVISSASDYMAEGCDAEDEESEAFQDSSRCGIGVTESRFTYEDDSEGQYKEEQFDPREFFWDRTARKNNIVDARRMGRARRMPYRDACDLFPGVRRADLDASWADGLCAYEGDPRSIEEKRIRDGEHSYEDDDDRNEVMLVTIEWIEKEAYWLVADAESNTKVELSEREYRMLALRFKQLGMPLTAVRLTRKCYYKAWLGNTLLARGRAPCGDRFSWNVITGHFDKKKRRWYGLIRVMRDPQMWANKFFAQIMQIMNATAKGGILAETDAFEDQEDAEDGYALPENITWVASGALSGAKPKIMPKPGQGNAEAYVELLQFAITSIRDVSGINVELLGQQDMQQPGVVEAMRKQAGMTVLAKLFDSLRRFRKGVARTRLFFIQTKMSDGRLVRVVGPDYVKWVPLAREMTAGKYDVIVSDAPTSPNQKESNWAIIAPMLPAFKEVLMAKPKVLLAVLRYSPLPAPLIDEIQRVITESENDPAQAQQAQQMTQLAVRKLLAEATKDESTARLNDARAQTAGSDAAYSMAMASNLVEDNQRDRESNAADTIRAHAEASLSAANVGLVRAKTVKETIEARKAAQPEGVDHAAILKARTDALRQQADTLAEQDRLRTERMATLSKVAVDRTVAIKNIAQAHRERVGATVDMRPDPKPAGQ